MSSLNKADSLKKFVDEYILTEPTFKGLSKYISNINFYWVSEIDTACAGHGFIFFNPDFWNSLPESKRKTVIAHEIWHLILEHLERGKNKDWEIYNQAADYVINNMLHEDGFDLKGKFGHIEICFDTKYANMSTENIYEELYQEKQKQLTSNSNKQTLNNNNNSPTPTIEQIEDLIKETIKGDTGDLIKQIENNKKELENLYKENISGIQQRILKANFINKIKKQDYNKIFEKYMVDSLSGGKRTYLRPSRRPSNTLRLKGNNTRKGTKNRLTHLVYALDVSGSISTQQANQFLKSVKTVKKLLNPKLMTILFWDTRIVFEKIYKESDNIDDLNIQAGGSTNVNCVLNKTDTIKPEALIVFSDMQFTFPKPEPEYDVIWFVPKNVFQESIYITNVTFGKIYYIPED